VERPAQTRGNSKRCAQDGSRCFRAASALIVILLACAGGARGQHAPSEYQVKAAFLFNFGKFVEWPQSSFASPQAPFWVCVLGEDPFGSSLDDTLRAKAIDGHPVSVTRIKGATSARGCQIVFVSASEKARLPAILGSLRGWNALVVGESEGFAAAGGGIQFLLEENRVRFAINPDAIRRAGLQASSRLLALAKIVHDDPRTGKN